MPLSAPEVAVRSVDAATLDPQRRRDVGPLP